MLSLSATNLLSLSSASSISPTLSRPCSSAITASLRSQVHFTGRRSMAATMLERSNSHLALGDLEHVLRQHVAHAMGILHVGIEGHAILARIVGAERAARLH